MKYVIINKGRYVADSQKRIGRSSYTSKLKYAQIFASIEDAKRNKCGDEYIKEAKEL